MIPVTTFDGKPVALFGLGGSGLATALALRRGGASVAAWDDSEAARDAARDKGVPVVDLAGADWAGFAALVLAPGVPLTHPEPHWTARAARAAGTEIIGDIELYCRERRKIALPTPFYAITGTNGKSTTTTLLAHLLATFGYRVEMGGNIGTPILELSPPAPDVCHVIECSSFQIDLARSLDPYVGVLLNVTPDHLDRHGTIEHYAAIKERLVAQADVAVIGLDDPYCVAIAERLRRAGKPGTSISATRTNLTDGIVLDGARLLRCVGGRHLPIADLAGIASLRGRHNGQNAAAAVAALGAHAHNTALVQSGLRGFPGLAHRMEDVARAGRVLFVNDSKATNADAAEKALTAFDNIYWIAGGKAKEGGIEPLRRHFGRIAKAYLIGAASDDFATTLEGSLPYARCGTLDVAVREAARDARASGGDAVVLLSPACASYDQFRNFELRGDAFRAAVKTTLAQAA
jgi:UDP-N-acetylmuramoylalanine--D-glutamate ligase